MRQEGEEEIKMEAFQGQRLSGGIHAKRET